MSTHDFPQDQLDLHVEVRSIVKEAAKNKGSNKTSNERVARKAYTPEHDIQILTVLKDDDRAERFGAASTEEKRELCEEMCEVLKTVHNQERTPDSLFYRITKLLKIADLGEINYRIKNDDAPTKPKVKKEKKETPAPAAEEKSESETETEGAASTTVEPEETQTETKAPAETEDSASDSDVEEFDDDDFLE